MVHLRCILSVLAEFFIWIESVTCVMEVFFATCEDQFRQSMLFMAWARVSFSFETARARVVRCFNELLADVREAYAEYFRLGYAIDDKLWLLTTA